jgi:hypothetical protein
VFILLPSLKLRYIFRQTKEFDEDEYDDKDDDEDEDEDEDDDTDDEVQEEEDWDEEMGEEDNEEEYEGEGEGAGGSDGEGKGEKEQSPDEEMGAGEGEEAGGSDGDLDIGDGDFTAYRAPFSYFPLLKHHAHPFFVIVNAKPKLGANLLSLTPEQNTLLHLMVSIEAIWSRRLDQALAQPRPSKRRRSDDEPPDDDDDDGGPKRKYKPTTSQATPTKRQTRASAAAVNVGKGKAKQTRANKETSRAQSHRQSPYPTPRTSRYPAIDKKISLFDDVSEVSAWVDAVAAAGPPEQADQIIVWSDNEDVRAPIRDWDNWRVSYKQPSKSARFCSSDWVMYLYSIPLWLPSYP